MPLSRFVRDLSENGKEILSMNEVVSYMLRFGILHNEATTCNTVHSQILRTSQR